MRCPKCNSENTQVQSKEYKPKLTAPIILTCGGFGLMFFGIGAIVGVIIGAIIAAIVNSVLPQVYQPVMVCQDCGYVSQPSKRSINQKHEETQTHKETQAPPLSCEMGDSNLMIVRASGSYGSLCSIGVRIDDSLSFEIKDGETKYLKVEPGNHRVTYYQVNGMGKKQRNGWVDINIGEGKRVVGLKVHRKGMDVFVK